MIFKSIINNKNDSLIMASEFIKSKAADKNFIENFIEIVNHLDERYEVKKKALYHSDGRTVRFPIKFDVKNILGMRQTADIVKKLWRHRECLELRIDSKYSHHRVIFFIHDDNIEPSVVLSYGFTKINEQSNTDLTDLSAAETDVISKEVHISISKKIFWIGDKTNEYRF